MNLLAINSESGERILELIELASLLIEVLAVGIIATIVLFSTVRYIYQVIRAHGTTKERYTDYRQSLGRSLLLGLEILVAADIVRTVALEPTFESVGVLGLLVLIRIILGWSLTVEIEGHWPWHPSKKYETFE